MQRNSTPSDKLRGEISTTSKCTEVGSAPFIGLNFFGRGCALKSEKKTPIGDIDLPSTIVQLKVEMLSTLVDLKEIIEILYHVFSCL